MSLRMYGLKVKESSAVDYPVVAETVVDKHLYNSYSQHIVNMPLLSS